MISTTSTHVAPRLGPNERVVFLLQKEIWMPHPFPSPQLKPLFELSATLERFDDLGETPQGHRMMAVVGQGSGTISGDRVRGQVLHGSGGDWLLLRPDADKQPQHHSRDCQTSQGANTISLIAERGSDCRMGRKARSS